MPSEKLVVIFTRTFRPLVYFIRYFVWASHLTPSIKGRTWTEGVWEGCAYENIWTLQEITGECAKLYNEGFCNLYTLHQMRVIEQKNRCWYVTPMKRSTVPWELSWPYTTASDATQAQQTTQFEQGLNFRHISMHQTTDVTKWNTFLCNISYRMFLIILSSNSISGQMNTHLTYTKPINMQHTMHYRAPLVLTQHFIPS